VPQLLNETLSKEEKPMIKEGERSKSAEHPERTACRHLEWGPQAKADEEEKKRRDLTPLRNQTNRSEKKGKEEFGSR